ncbi:peroxiredoxin-like family protein [Lutibacter holmesii]|uniref:thioredoxin-dependent peroxiredoxin n=1 Tax=Lutibacter holmesii TaxID=1137985 RepID=A0ABW3WLW7_9FLAO
MLQKTTAIIIMVLALTVSCQTKESKKESTIKAETSKMETTNKQGELEALLSKKAAASAAKSSEEKKKAYAKGIEDVKNSGVLESALKVGDKAPNFTLNNATNTPVSLYDELKNGPVILTWYRGGWCPYCNITLHALQDNLPEFTKAGATLMALTPELPDKSLSTSEKNELEFTVLSDINNKVGKEYGVVYQLNSTIASMYEKGFGLSTYNGNSSSELPLAATYVIDKNGIIQYAFLDEDYKKRAEPSEIITALHQLK